MSGCRGTRVPGRALRGSTGPAVWGAHAVVVAAGVRVPGPGAGGCLLAVGGGERGAGPVGDDLPVLHVLTLVTANSICPTPP